jgi:GNAT superfamily N-acetyltransferase
MQPHPQGPTPSQLAQRLPRAGRAPDEPHGAISVRRIRVGDALDLERFYVDLDPETRWLRFHAATVGLSHRQSAWFCRPDRDRHEGFVAVARRPGIPERIVAHLCLEPDSPSEAEIALVVEPGFQHCGIGRRMVEDAVAWARGAGIRTLSATMLVGNEPIRRLLTSLGLATRWLALDAGACELIIDLTARPASPRGLA